MPPRPVSNVRSGRTSALSTTTLTAPPSPPPPTDDRSISRLVSRLRFLYFVPFRSGWPHDEQGWEEGGGYDGWLQGELAETAMYRAIPAPLRAVRRAGAV
jgi:hypothetical protein